MEEPMRVYNDIGIMIPSCLLPSDMKARSLEQWVTIACDQYVHDIDYWTQLYQTRKEIPSTLHIVLPHVFLVEPKAILTPVEMLIHTEYQLRKMEEQRKEMFDTRMEALKRVMVDRVNRRMIEYTEGGILKENKPCMNYVERKLPNGTTRKGLLMCIDLEKYSFEEGSQSLIRPTKRTIPGVINANLNIRKNATLEVPHVLIFVDDQDNELIKPLRSKLSEKDKIYDFSFVIQNKANVITGYELSQDVEEYVINTLRKFSSPEVQKERYGLKEGESPMLFAIGDGNHSLGTAKAHWEYIKRKFQELRLKPPKNHPSRYSLVEVISLYDESVEDFEPVHRIVKNIDFEYLMEELVKKHPDSIIKTVGMEDEHFDIEREKEELLREFPESHFFPFFAEERKGYVLLKKPEGILEVVSLMNFLDGVVDEEQMEYIFEEEVAVKMAEKKGLGRVAFLLPKMEKKNLFKHCIKFGVVPRKAYSIGLHYSKRVYLECRRIQKKMNE